MHHTNWLYTGVCAPEWKPENEAPSARALLALGMRVATCTDNHSVAHQQRKLVLRLPP